MSESCVIPCFHRRASGFKEEKPQVYLACLLLLEDCIPALCRGCGLEGGEAGGATPPSQVLVNTLMSTCTTLLGAVLPVVHGGQQLFFPGPSQERNVVQVALRIVHKVLEGGNSGALVRLARNAR